MMVAAGLLRAVRNMLPDAQIALVNERPWYSLTFAGVQICVSVILSGKDHLAIADEAARKLPTHEFDLHDRLVADIAIIETVAGNNETRLLIGALILED